MEIFITGICGFVGAAIAKHLTEHGSHKIRGIDNLSRRGSQINAKLLGELGVDVFHGDIRMASDLEMADGSVDWVIDAAALPSVMAGVDGNSSSRQLVEHNLGGTLQLLEWVKKHRAGLVLLSTSRVYSIDRLAHLPIRVSEHEQRFHLDIDRLSAVAPSLGQSVGERGISVEFPTDSPVSLYGATKIASEVMALEYGETFDLPVWINRCGVLAGPGQFGRIDQGIFSYWIHSMAAGNPLKYIGFGGNGFQVRDALHPKDLARLIEKQINAPEKDKPKIINVGGGPERSMSLAELTKFCLDRMDLRPDSMPTGLSETRRFDVPWVVMDNRLASESWGWEPELTMTQILEEIVEHARQNPDWIERCR